MLRYRIRLRPVVRGLLTVAAFTLLRCGDGDPDKPGDAVLSDTEQSDAVVSDEPVIFEPVAPASYVAKVKSLLVGLPPTDDELMRVEANPSALADLIAEWMQLPQYTEKLQRFFELAFQQTQISVADFEDQAYPRPLGIHLTTIPRLIQNASESFARTMVALIEQGQPLTAAVTTRKFMLTTALAELYAFLDVQQVDNAGKVTDAFARANPDLRMQVTSKERIPISETLDPDSPNYFRWYNPDVATVRQLDAKCVSDTYEFPAKAQLLNYILYGSLDGHHLANGMRCKGERGSGRTPQLQAEDFNDWRMVEVRAPNSDETPATFYDLPALRSATALLLTLPRIGFFSTPAFFANWPTNISNQMRVTINQTLIVALGQDVDGKDPTMPQGDPIPGLDSQHAGAPECVFCHRTLDPLRSIFSSTYSWYYHRQADDALAAQTGEFAFWNRNAQVNDLGDFANQLASHPKFAEAWPQKLCYYANSAPCSADDPEFQRIVQVFRDSNYDWNTLVKAVFASPLITNASPTQTSAAQGEVITVARVDHLCSALSTRLGLGDVCGLAEIAAAKLKAPIPQIAQGLPSDGYGRGAVAPVLPNQPTLLYAAATDNICAEIAPQVIDRATDKPVPGSQVWRAANPYAAIADFVSLVMALPPSDARAAPATELLNDHYRDALAQTKSPSTALQSTFVTACLAPSAISIGL
ncbi:MAG TPA: DUF1585 domain-containing protein [Polyangiales bacterium]|nr:DUF1585 domain-containing protein [Polyangiales bacterium]